MKPCVATVGTFDGLHKGHISILEALRHAAEENQLESKIITFTNHPLSVVAPSRAPLWAIRREASLDALRPYADQVCAIEFTAPLASLTAARFMKVLKEEYEVKLLVMGYDNTFGSDRLSSRRQYEEAARTAGIKIIWVDAARTPDGLPISSSRLRKAIADGNLTLVAHLLPAPLRFFSKVVEGRKFGRTIGFPTMNLEIPADVVGLPDAVYACQVFIDTLDNPLPGVLAVSNTPTVAPTEKHTWEMHVPGYNLGDMYGKRIKFTVLKKIRDIKKFDNAEQLKAAIDCDVRIAKQIFVNNSINNHS